MVRARVLVDSEWRRLLCIVMPKFHFIALDTGFKFLLYGSTIHDSLVSGWHLVFEGVSQLPGLSIWQLFLFCCTYIYITAWFWSYLGRHKWWIIRFLSNISYRPIRLFCLHIFWIDSGTLVPSLQLHPFLKWSLVFELVCSVGDCVVEVKFAF